MAEIIQRQEPEAFPPNIAGNGSQSRQAKQRSVAEPIKDKPSGQASRGREAYEVQARDPNRKFQLIGAED
jgi:hypothetical protein